MNINLVLNYYTITGLLIFVTSLLFGVVLLGKDFRSPLNRSFALFTLSVSGWTFFYYFWQISDNYESALFYARLLMAFAIFIPANYLYMVIVFLKQVQQKRWLIIITYLTFLFFLVLNFTPLMVSSVEPNAYFRFWPAAGNIFGVFLLLWFLTIFYTSYLLYKNYKTAVDKEKKKQILLILLGVCIAFVGGSTNYFMWFQIPIPPVGNIVGPIYIVLIGWAIIKHNLMNIKLIVTELASYLLVMVLIFEIFLSRSLFELVLRSIFLILLIYGVYVLIRSVKLEIYQKEQLQKLSQELTQANEHLKELDRMKTEFVSLASHELLTPVSAIEGYLSMLLDEKLAKIEDPKAQRYMDRVYTSAKRLARLVTDMLNVSRIEEGRLLVEKKEIDLSELIKQVTEEIHFKAEEKKQKIIFQPDSWQTYGDTDKLKEILINIIGNSIKYSRDPGTITLTIEKVPTSEVAEKWQKVEDEIKARPLDDQEAIKSAVDPHLRDLVGKEQLLIAVKDQGIGIPKEELPRLFKKFHRVGDYTTAESQGTGLGLYISRALVELHHGRIWADSEGPSHGSTFTFSLPDISSEQELIDLESQAPQPKEQLKPLARPVKEAEDI